MTRFGDLFRKGLFRLSYNDMTSTTVNRVNAMRVATVPLHSCAWLRSLFLDPAPTRYTANEQFGSRNHLFARPVAARVMINISAIKNDTRTVE